MERQRWANSQYSRRECLDEIGIFSEVDADVLERKSLIFMMSLVVIFLQSELNTAKESEKIVQ